MINAKTAKIAFNVLSDVKDIANKLVKPKEAVKAPSWLHKVTAVYKWWKEGDRTVELRFGSSEADSYITAYDNTYGVTCMVRSIDELPTVDQLVQKQRELFSRQYGE
jgi:hypothetical protein